jgi:hypothetical protein
MTTFTSEDRENAMDMPTVIVDSGASIMTLRDAIDQDGRFEMYREQIHAQQCEINALRKALMYNKPKDLTDGEIQELALCDEFWISEDCTIFDWHKFARAILRKAQE